MSTDFLDRIEKLPIDKKKEVEDFADLLLFKVDGDFKKAADGAIKPGFGGGKGIIGYMADDFDSLLDELKDYM